MMHLPENKDIVLRFFLSFFIGEVRFNGVVRLIACAGKLIWSAGTWEDSCCGPGCASLDYVTV
jgi:hypothetical protein